MWIELGGLARRLFLFSRTSESTVDDYNEAAKSYYTILEKYENHVAADYLVALDTDESRKVGQQPLFSLVGFRTRLHVLSVKGKIIAWHAIQFSHYVISMVLMWLWIYFLVAQKAG